MGACLAKKMPSPPPEQSTPAESARSPSDKLPSTSPNVLPIPSTSATVSVSEDMKELGTGFDLTRSNTNARFRSSVAQPLPENPPFTENIWHVYKRDEILGEGAGGKVYAVTKKDNGNRYALKQTKMNDPDEVDAFNREVSVLKMMDHPNIIKLSRTWRDKKSNYIVTKLCEGGQLLHRVQKEQFLSEKFAAQIMQAVVKAIAHAHEYEVVHSDLKPENIVFDTTEEDTPILIDWGSARILNPREEISDSSGTRVYAPPEVYRNRKSWELKKSDMWSIGVITYVLLTGTPPFKGKNKQELVRNVCKKPLEFPRDIPLSNEAIDFISRCLKRNTKRRISAHEALQLPWLLRASAQSDENIMNLVFEDMNALASASLLQKFLLNSQVKQLPKQKKDQLRVMFEQIDTDNSGTIDIDEFAEHLKRVRTEQLTDDMARQRAEILIRSVTGKDGAELALRDFAKAHVAHEMFTKGGMSKIFQSITEDSETLDVEDFERLFRKSFGRGATERESQMLSSQFEQHFGKNSVSEAEFCQNLGLGTEKTAQELLVLEMIGSNESNADSNA